MSSAETVDKEMTKKLEMERRDKILKDYLNSPEYTERLQDRVKIVDAAERSLEARAYVWHLCARPDNPVEGCKFFVNNFLFTFNPKLQPHHFPFITFAFQDRAIEWTVDHVINGEDGMIEKSREMGVSWLVFCAVTLWFWLFRDGSNILLGSYKEALVDNKTDDSLFGKIDYMLDSLPKWMLPKRFNFNKHRTKLKLINPATGNAITGDTMNPKFGRGTRKTAIFFDELGFWDYAKDAWEGCSDSTNCKIANSTPNGYNYYALLKDTGIDVLTLHWPEHPLKDQQWYEFEKTRRTTEEIAQELDISYTKSREGVIYQEWDEENVTKGLFEYDPNFPLYVGWDFGKTDDTAMIWIQPNANGGWNIIDTYNNRNKNIDFYIPFVNGIMDSDLNYQYTKSDLDIIERHKSWPTGIHFGDPAGRFQNQVSDVTVIDVLRNYGIRVNFQDAWKHFNLRKTAAKRIIMDGIGLNENPRTDYFNLSMINSSYPKVQQEGQKVVRSEKPKHDQYSHYRSAFEYLCLGLEDLNNRRDNGGSKKDKKKPNKRRVSGY